MATTACCQRGVRQRGMAARAVEQLAAALREWIGKGLGSCTVGAFYTSAWEGVGIYRVGRGALARWP